MPTLSVVAGPNGSGKSSLTRSVALDGQDRLLDPDAVAREMNPANPAAAAIAAGREVLIRTERYLEERLSFVVETTLSSPGRVAMMRKAKRLGYEVRFVFVALDTPERSIRRIQNRVSLGGHFVPDEDVRRRYGRSIANAAVAAAIADKSYFYDNSGDGHRLVLVAEKGVVTWRAAAMPGWVPL